ncbi:MAG: hypothetical protein WCP97_08220 [bacterium]
MRKIILFVLGGVMIILGLTGCNIGGSSNLAIRNLAVEKSTIDKTAYRVALSFQVGGFAYKDENGKYTINLVQDLELKDPKGNVVESLTRKNFKRLTQTLEKKLDQDQVFTNDLTIPISFGIGDYEAIVTVHDLNSGKDMVSSVKFNLDEIK